ncbi:hypothetical protein RHSIM_Rhsim03G0024200 [Rhododendron simsii]|uniref:Protein N-terminal glutamine amidohydrolase n=1 Tax=Rhododendron simsii TaxID=118357 RepID=A0A834LUI1_RHOSS|nr:hypothetical protein RHSIM_Rhsim03G0024200 [Rhododendron simsii]
MTIVQFPLWHQEAIHRADGYSMDYHFICIRFFWVVHAPIFVRFFASDRRHMKDSLGNWTAKPPAYGPIVAEDETVHNLNEYMEIIAADVVSNVGSDSIIAVRSHKLGIVVNETQLEEFFSLDDL